MSSGMNLEEAKEYAETMSYRKAINNIRYAKGIAYKKATWIKLRELAEIADKLVWCGECKHNYGNPPIADGRSWCKKHNSFMYYCSDGEREGE